MKQVLLSFVFITFCLSVAYGQQTQPPTTIEPVPLSNGYVPIGFDEINKTQITVEGVFKNTCYRVGPHQVSVAADTITIRQGAYYYPGTCADVLVPFSQVIDLGILRVGTYRIVDAVSGATLGNLPIKKAPPKSPLTYPDDYLYAPITDASVLVDNAQPRIVLTGAFGDDCTKLSDIRIAQYGNVIQVLPITERGTSCTRGYHPFQITKPLTVPEGHYLLHVRSLSGNAINKMVDIYFYPN